MRADQLARLVAFLFARIDDEVVAAHKRQRQLRSRPVGVIGGSSAEAADLDQRLAECAARREMVGIVQRLFILRDLPSDKQLQRSAERLLHLMAVPYATHPSYRSDWRVTTRQPTGNLDQERGTV